DENGVKLGHTLPEIINMGPGPPARSITKSITQNHVIIDHNLHPSLPMQVLFSLNITGRFIVSLAVPNIFSMRFVGVDHF
ncbi:hypothetical protein L9F63_005901, partial [Diploptera punctata]